MSSTLIHLRRSLYAKLALFLADSENRAMVDFAELDAEPITFTVGANPKPYAMALKSEGEIPSWSAVNVSFLDVIDASPLRGINKRLIQPIIIRVIRELEGGFKPFQLEEEVLTIIGLVQKCFCERNNRCVEIWDYSADPPVQITGTKGTWLDQALTAVNESDPTPGGDLRYSINFNVEFLNKTYG